MNRQRLNRLLKVIIPEINTLRLDFSQYIMTQKSMCLGGFCCADREFQLEGLEITLSGSNNNDTVVPRYQQRTGTDALSLFFDINRYETISLFGADSTDNVIEELDIRTKYLKQLLFNEE